MRGLKSLKEVKRKNRRPNHAGSTVEDNRSDEDPQHDTDDNSNDHRPAGAKIEPGSFHLECSYLLGFLDGKTTFSSDILV